MRADEREKITKLDVTKKVTHWFVIEASWLESWRNFVAGGDRPGPIDNSSLVERDEEGRYRAREGLLKAKHYRAVNHKVWSFFQDSYGGGPTLVRERVDIYAAEKWPTAPKTPSEIDEIVLALRSKNCPWAHGCIEEIGIRSQVVDAMVPVRYSAKSMAMEQGDTGIDFFIIRSGECTMGVVQQCVTRNFALCSSVTLD